MKRQGTDLLRLLAILALCGLATRILAPSPNLANYLDPSVSINASGTRAYQP